MPSTPQPSGPEPSGARRDAAGARPDDFLRASDEERDVVASLLSENTAAGRLDLTEFDQRVTAAHTVKTRGELRALLADLPSGQPSAEPVRTAPVRPVPEVARTGQRLAPYRNWLLTGAVCLTIWAATSVAAGTVLYFWPFWVIVPWGVMLAGGARHGRTPCGGRPVHPRTQ